MKYSYFVEFKNKQAPKGRGYFKTTIKRQAAFFYVWSLLNLPRGTEVSFLRTSGSGKRHTIESGKAGAS
jgi:hypothetical protein